MSGFVGRWQGHGWQALLSSEPYGYHFSVSGRGQPPSGAEVQDAFAVAGLTISLEEVTEAWSVLGQVNPYVRQFVPPGEARRMRKAADKRSA